MIEEIFKKRKHVREYDTSVEISSELIDSLLRKTWSMTPSKNQFMPYTAHVLGNQHQEYKDIVLDICRAKDNTPFTNPEFLHMKTCSYMIIFTLRHEDEPNEEMFRRMSKRIVYEQSSSKLLNKHPANAFLELGLFVNTLTGLCLENSIDVSYTRCFLEDRSKWKSAGLTFIDETPMLVLTMGKGHSYRVDAAKEEGWFDTDLKPEYERIVNFI
tara:strand:+ start:220 stop:861 length:642 start_codon:yes stop_codon:yes gene_type:complete